MSQSWKIYQAMKAFEWYRLPPGDLPNYLIVLTHSQRIKVIYLAKMKELNMKTCDSVRLNFVDYALLDVIAFRFSLLSGAAHRLFLRHDSILGKQLRNIQTKVSCILHFSAASSKNPHISRSGQLALFAATIFRFQLEIKITAASMKTKHFFTRFCF